MLNRCEFIGNLGADPEIRRLNSGELVANLRLAVSEKWKSNDGESKERTEWVSIVIFNQGLAKLAEGYLKKGSKIFIAGKMQTRRWQDQQGNDKYTTEVVLQKLRGELQMLDSRGDGQQTGQQCQSQQSSQSYSQQSAGYGGGFENDLDDDNSF